ncbi:MAG: hypothetical protein DKT66_04845 [Candidatus Melainabacteria bacterium]|nr:MAG: hypothetical protein DKT66_04845 [Candidatus Melainabacteria bacterium]
MIYLSGKAVILKAALLLILVSTSSFANAVEEKSSKLNSLSWKFLSESEASHLLKEKKSMITKEWTDTEKQHLSNDLKTLRLKLPCLCLRVGKIGFARVKDIPSFGECKAATTYQVVVISDHFFKSPEDELSTLAHEFVHRADSGGQLAYSRRWIEFAEKNVVFSKRAGLEPSLKERLAIAMEFYIEGKKNFDRVNFERKILPLLTDVSARSLRLNRLLALANNEHSAHRYDSALRLYEQANKLLPEAPTILYGEACCKASQHKDQEAIDLLDRASKVFQKNHIPIYDPMATTVLLLQSSYFCERNKLVESLALLKSLEETQPSGKILATIQSIKKQCQRKITP